MKRINVFGMIPVLALLVLTLAACGKSEFEVTANTEKQMIVTAEKADKGASFMVGALEVADGEQVVITSDLKEGMVKVEIIRAAEEQSIDTVPETDGEVVLYADVKGKDGASATMSAGSYLLRASCLEKATGTIQIQAVPAG